MRDTKCASLQTQMAISSCTGAMSNVSVFGAAAADDGYTQMPKKPPTIAHLAPVWHFFNRPHMSAQYWLPVVSLSAHCGRAVAPSGMSVGHCPAASHFGA